MAFSHLNTITVTAKYLTTSGGAAAGTVTFVPAFDAITDTVANEIVVPNRITATLSGSGQISQVLPSTNDPDVSPTGWTYTVTESINNAVRSREYSISVPYDAAGSTIDLADIAPQDESSTGSFNGILVTGTPSDGDTASATGAASAIWLSNPNVRVRTTDDLQDVLTDAASGARKVITLLPGDHVYDLVDNLGGSGIASALLIPPDCTLEIPSGATVALDDSQSVSAVDGNSAFIRNLHPSSGGGDTDIRVIGAGVVDGNAANQSAESVIHGIRFDYCRRASVAQGLTVKNCRGTTSGGATEAFSIQFQRSPDFSVSDVVVCTDDGGETATGLAVTHSALGRIENVTAFGMDNGHGFALNDVQGVTLSNCYAYFNGSAGFNLESLFDVDLIGCHAGGTNVGSAAVFTSDQRLGNGQVSGATNPHGITINGCTSTRVIGGSSRWNGVSATNDPSGIRITGTCADILIDGVQVEHNYIGVNLGNSGAEGRAAVTNVTRPQLVRDNDRGSGGSYKNFYRVGAGSTALAVTSGAVGATFDIPLASTTVAMPNTFPFPIDLVVSGGTVTVISITGGGGHAASATATGLTSGTFRVPVGGSLTITYSSAPTLKTFIP